MTTLPLRRRYVYYTSVHVKRGKRQRFPLEFGAGNESRTRDLNLGKVALYQLSYSRIVFCTAAYLPKWKTASQYIWIFSAAQIHKPGQRPTEPIKIK